MFSFTNIFSKRTQNINRKPHVLLLCDRPNWAHHNSAIEIQSKLQEEFEIDIKYVIDNPKIKSKDYDALLVFFWGETIYKKWNFPSYKIIKQISSHRWEDNPAYGPCTPREFYDKYLKDAETFICPSQILYRILEPYCEHLFLCGKGYSPQKFFYMNKRMGNAVTLCMAGNIKDPVKGVEDILIPSAKGYKLDLAHDIPHEKLCEFYNSHDLYVVTSKNEADPLPLIESMACGCFPVSCKVGIAPELIRHKENGYLVEDRTPEAFREAYDWCQNNLDHVREYGKKNSEEIFLSRRWEIMIKNYREMLWNVINRQKEMNSYRQ